MTKEPEVLILGGGPAGSAAAGLLARWGLKVVVVERVLGGGLAGPDEESLAESLPPSTRKVLAATGLLGVV
ncbi:MAG: NAD(P)/FAD-dependent oxidoreductase, partial [Gemmatimonadetes bacterium]|nr:NAD(P)/FAD-dependent oxidoreductase [Gemmatimonadota bacterium]